MYYPIKANSNFALVSFLNNFVDGYEVDSLYHISTLIRKHKVSADRILYSYPLKNRKEIRSALNMGISNFVIDDINECRQILDVASTPVKLIVRIDVTSYIKVQNLIVKWGATSHEISEIIRSINDSIHKINGFSFYLPQEISSFENFELVIDKLFAEFDVGNYDILDIGGGIADDMLPKIVSKLQSFISRSKTKIIIEQGQYLLNPTIDLQVNVLEVRYKNRNKMVFIDSGIYHGLLDAILKKVNYKIVAGNTCETEECIVCGDSSDISDIIGVYKLPKNIKCGDLLTIKGCGAYCEEFITPFSKKKKPTVRLT